MHVMCEHARIGEWVVWVCGGGSGFARARAYEFGVHAGKRARIPDLDMRVGVIYYTGIVYYTATFKTCSTRLECHYTSVAFNYTSSLLGLTPCLTPCYTSSLLGLIPCLTHYTSVAFNYTSSLLGLTPGLNPRYTSSMPLHVCGIQLRVFFARSHPRPHPMLHVFYARPHPSRPASSRVTRPHAETWHARRRIGSM
jgi:hypothetical protein